MKSRKGVLLTGGTGFVGKAVLARLVDVSRYGKIYLIVRPGRDASVQDRVRDIVKSLFPAGRQEELAARIVAVQGDLTKPGMGIPKAELDKLRGEVHQLLHIGASTDFGAPLDESRRHNVEGTRHALEVALDLKANGVMERFDYVSTAYVAGRKRGVVGEDDLERGQAFSNTYEQTKYEAEVLVRSYAARIPTAIYRPSIVVGDSRNGYTPHFKVLYWPLLLLSKNLLPFFACNKRAHLDVVPVDYVADALVTLMQRDEAVGGTFHVTAGFGNEIRIRELLRDAYRYAGIRKRPIFSYLVFHVIRLTPLKRVFHESFWSAVELARPYSRYLRGNGVRFDAKRTKALLERLGVHAPRWEQYKREVLGYCTASRWGRKVPLPEYVYYLPAANASSAHATSQDEGKSVVRLQSEPAY